jgi:TPR repeat protein
MVETIQKDFDEFKINYEENINNSSNYLVIKYENIKSNFLMAIEGDSDAMYNLGRHYYFQYDFKRTEKYYLMAVEKGCLIAMNKLAKYYEAVRKYEETEKYYLMAIENGCSDAMYGLGRYYQDRRDYENMKKYYLMNLNKGKIIAMYDLDNYYKTNKLAFYALLINIENKSDFINNKLDELKSDSLVIKNHDNIHECDVCMETKINITLLCNHDICVDCYPNINKCHMCRTSIVKD